MADNTFDGLAKKYKDFEVPAVKITLGESSLIDDLDGHVERVEVSLELRGESRADIMLWDCYDVDKHAIATKLKNALKPGSKLEVSLGYGSSCKKVFSGYLGFAELGMSEKQGYTIRLGGFDAVHLMKENRHVRIFKKDKHSAIFTDVMKPYSWVCKAKADDTPAMDEGEVRMQECDDYRFVTEELAGAENPEWEFYVQTGTAYFTKPEASPADVISLKPEHGVRFMAASWGFLNRAVQVQGCDKEDTVFTADETAKAATLDSSAGADEDFQSVPYLDTEAKVKAWAAAESKRLKGGTKKASLSLVGMPELLAGGYMSLEEFDSLANGQYRILKAVHVLDHEGYRTDVELGGG